MVTRQLSAADVHHPPSLTGIRLGIVLHVPSSSLKVAVSRTCKPVLKRLALVLQACPETAWFGPAFVCEESTTTHTAWNHFCYMRCLLNVDPT